MTPVFEGDQVKTSALQAPLPAGLYTMSVGTPSLQYNDKNGKVSAAVKYPLSVLEADDHKLVGRKYFHNCWIHSDGGRKMSKLFIMACHGYKPNADGQAKLNAYIEGLGPDADKVDTDTNEIGPYWMGVVGSRVVADLEIQPDKNDQPQQNARRFLPPKDASATA
jgi:hypothetical protein